MTLWRRMWMVGGVTACLVLAGFFYYFQRDEPVLVLYLTGHEPSPELAPRRVDASHMHLGTLSLTPPTAASQRSCGDVVAFAVEAGVFPEHRYYVKEVLYRVWWESGSQHGHFSLNSPGLPHGLGQLSVAECERPGDDPGREGAYTLAMRRVPVDHTFTADELKELYLAIDVADSAIRVGTCPSRASMLVLNPPTDDEMRGKDLDRDGVDDLVELYDVRRDPFRPDPPDKSCLPIINHISRPPKSPLPTLPQPTRTVRGEEIEGTVTFKDEVVKVVGTMVIRGSLIIDGATVILAAESSAGVNGDRMVERGEGDPLIAGPIVDIEGAPVLKVEQGGSLHIFHHATVAAADPSVGFSIDGEPGSHVVLEESVFLHPGMVATAGRGMPEPYSGLSLRGAGAVVRGNTFQHGLRVIGIWSEGVVVEGNHFEHNASDITVNGAGCHILGNTSLGAGHFIRLDMFSRGCEVRDNEAQWILRGGLIFDPVATGHQVIHNRILRSPDVLVMDHAAGNTLKDNVLTHCDIGPTNVYEEDEKRNIFVNNQIGPAQGCEEGIRLAPVIPSDRPTAPLATGRPAPGEKGFLPEPGRGTLPGSAAGFVPEPGVIGPPPRLSPSASGGSP